MEPIKRSFSIQDVIKKIIQKNLEYARAAVERCKLERIKSIQIKLGDG